VSALEAIAATRVLVLLLEDLHWSDVSTVDTLSALARRTQPARLLALGTFRADEARAAAHPIAVVAQELRLRGLATELGLGALTPSAVVEYLERRLPGGRLPQELASLLHERTGGNPLFLEKVVDSWVESGSVAQTDGSWVLEASIDELSANVPTTLRRLIEHQLERLPATDRELVEAGSVAGTEFAAAAVAAACGQDPREVESRLAELARQGRFVEEAGEAAWPDGTISGRFGFVHDLYAEIAYGQLLAGRRARLHHDLGRRLEAAYANRTDEVATELATHFVRARDADRGLAYLRLAAEQALSRKAYPEVVQHLSAALEIIASLPDSPERVEEELRLSVDLGNALLTTRGHAAPETREAYAHARELCASLGDGPRVLPVLYGLWNNAMVAANHVAAGELGESFLQLAELHNDDAVVVARRAVGWSRHVMGDLAAARSEFERVVSLYDPERHAELASTYGEDPGILANASLAESLWFLGYPDLASETSAGGLARARAENHPLTLAYALMSDAIVRQLRREPDAARERCETLAGVADTYAIPLYDAWASIVRGWADCELGEEAGIESMRAGLEAAEATGAVAFESYLLALLAEGYQRAGRAAESLETIDNALAFAGEKSERLYEAELRRLRGELLLVVPRPDEDAAEQGFRSAIELARSQQARSLELRAAVSLARLWRAQDKVADAREVLSNVFAWFDEGFDAPDLQQAAALLADLEGGLGGSRRGHAAHSPKASRRRT
jgi:predicted ATPase